MLTDAQCRNASCPVDKKQARFADSGGLYLQVSPNASKRWFWKYRIGGLEKRLALGSYPDVNLKLARAAGAVQELVIEVLAVRSAELLGYRAIEASKSRPLAEVDGLPRRDRATRDRRCRRCCTGNKGFL